MKCDSTRTETRFRLSAKRTSPFKSAGESVHSTAGSRGVRISGSNAGYTMFRGSVKGTGYPLHPPVSPSLPPPVRHRVPSHFNWTLRLLCFPSQCVYLCQTCFSTRNSTLVPVYIMCSMAVHCAYTINQQMHIYKYSHIIILYQHVSVTSVTIIRVS